MNESDSTTDPVAAAPTWLALGFRPFFLLGAPFASITILLWLHRLSGGSASSDYLPGPLWHAHEMVFGLVAAVVAGFLLTAARNWTKRPTLHGIPLGLLVGLWLAGRLTMALGASPPLLVAAIGVAFPLFLTLVLARVLIAAGSRRNYKIIAVLVAYTFAAAVVHLDANGLFEHLARPAIHAGVHLMVILVAIIAGRIIPMFTRNRLSIKTHNLDAVDRLALLASSVTGALAVYSLLQSDALEPGSPTAIAYAVIAGATGILHLTRMRTWGTRPALRVPMLAVLHVGYTWVGVGYILLGLSVADPTVSLTVALHALTIGGLGLLMIGMMARVALGHTGRKIVAPPMLSAAFALVCGAAVARVAAIVTPPHHLIKTWYVSGALFVAGFAIYAIAMSRVLVSPRPDGRAG